MKRPPPRKLTHPVPSDLQLQLCWSAGLNTADIAGKYYYHEGYVESRIWRLREQQRTQA
jgi:hypothetical protein